MQFGEGVFGDLGRDEGVSVTVAADPAGEAELGIGVVETEVVDVPTGIFPGEFEGAVEVFNLTNRRNVVTRNTNFGAGGYPGAGEYPGGGPNPGAGVNPGTGPYPGPGAGPGTGTGPNPAGPVRPVPFTDRLSAVRLPAPSPHPRGCC